MTLSATITSLSSHNSNLSLKSPPSWLVEIHSELWGRRDLYGKIFRTATLTKDDFTELQVLLDKQNPERISDSYKAKMFLLRNLHSYAPGAPLLAQILVTT